MSRSSGANAGSAPTSTRAVQDIVAAMLVGGAKTAVTYDGTLGTLTIDVTAASAADVATAVTNHAALITAVHGSVNAVSNAAILETAVAGGTATRVIVQGESNTPTGTALGDVWVPAPDGIGL